MVKPIIDLMLLSSMFGFVSGIMVGGSLANLAPSTAATVSKHRLG